MVTLGTITLLYIASVWLLLHDARSGVSGWILYILESVGLWIGVEVGCAFEFLLRLCTQL